jgi:hypothetical protein
VLTILKPWSSVQDVGEFEELSSSLALILSNLSLVTTVHIDSDFDSLTLQSGHLNIAVVGVLR